MKKTLLKRFTSVTLATALIGTMGVAAFAEDANPTEGKTITISKQLNIAQGLEAPTTDFNFVFTKKTEDGNNPTNAMPDLSGKVSYDKDKDTDADGYVMKNVTVDPATATWGHAGEYVYEVTETKGSVTGVTYDETSKYTVTIYVKNGDNGLEVDKIVVKDKDGKKVDVDTPDPTTKPEDDTDDLASGMKFTNTYTKIADSTPTGRTEDETTTETESTASYVVTKTVDGTYGDKTKQFKFTMTVDTTKTNVASPTIKYYKLGADKTTVTDITPAADGTVSFALADGEKLVVEGAPVGTLYTVTENLSADDAAAKKYAAGTVVTEKGVVNTTKGTTLKVNDDTTWGKDVKVENALVADGENSAAYTNENAKDDTTTPTGILINNAPYIILALVAAGGMTFYVVKKRKEN